jgi:putative colanic acid biosynthesis acetyltransferase WcaF
MQDDRIRPARAPYSFGIYVRRALWLFCQATLWRLAWKRIWFLRPAILKCFGARMAFSVQVSESVRIEFPWQMTMGKDNAIGPRVTFYNLGELHIGDRTVISQDAYLCGGTHDYSLTSYPLRRLPIVIEDDVWIGAGAFIGPGVRVGRGAVVGARAVVTKDVPEWKVVAGNPAQVIKDRVLKSG